MWQCKKCKTWVKSAGNPYVTKSRICLDCKKYPWLHIGRLCPCCKKIEVGDKFQCSKCTLHREACA